MIKNIRNVFTNMINQSMWMDSLSKSVAIKKVCTTSIIIEIKEIFINHTAPSNRSKNWLS